MATVEDTEQLVVAIRPHTGGFHVDGIMQAEAVTGQIGVHWSLRQRLNPEIRLILVDAPAGTDPEKWATAYDSLPHDEQFALYKKASSL